MFQEDTEELMDGVDNLKGHKELQCVNFSCSIPTVSGRGFIEVLWPLACYPSHGLFFCCPFLFSMGNNNMLVSDINFWYFIIVIDQLFGVIY